METLLAALQANDREEAHRQAHTFKGIAATLGPGRCRRSRPGWRAPSPGETMPPACCRWPNWGCNSSYNWPPAC